MLTFLLSIIGILGLCALSFVLGAVSCALGAYQKLKDAEGEDVAKLWLNKMRDKSYGHGEVR